MENKASLSLIDSLHVSYLQSKPYQLNTRTSVVVNTGGPPNQSARTVDASLGAKSWEHVKRRFEDNCILLQSLHPSSPSLFVHFLDNLPYTVPSSVSSSFRALQPFLHCATPDNPATALYSVLALTLDITAEGRVLRAALSIPVESIGVTNSLSRLSSKVGNCAFNVFHYLLISGSTAAERSFLNLKPASHYCMLSSNQSDRQDDTEAANGFRKALREIGIKGSVHRRLIATLAGILTLGNTLDHAAPSTDIIEACEEAGTLLGIDPEVLITITHHQRCEFIDRLYEATVDWIITKANESVVSELRSNVNSRRPRYGSGNTTLTGEDDIDNHARLIIFEIPDPSVGRAISLQTNFDESFGINAEAREDGIAMQSIDALVWKDAHLAMLERILDQEISPGQQSVDKPITDEATPYTFSKIVQFAENDSFLKDILLPKTGDRPEHPLNMRHVLNSSRIWYHLSLYSGSSTASEKASSPQLMGAPWSLVEVSKQLQSWRLQDWTNQMPIDPSLTVDFHVNEFLHRYSTILFRASGRDDIERWVFEMGWNRGDVVLGKQRVWMSEEAWRRAETMLDDTKFCLLRQHRRQSQLGDPASRRPESLFSGFDFDQNWHESSDNLLQEPFPSRLSASPATVTRLNLQKPMTGLPADDTLKQHRDPALIDPEIARPRHIEIKPVPLSRRIWVGFVFALTFWIPSVLLIHIGRMRRPDVRQAWQEKLSLVLIILFLNGLILFWMIGLGTLLCPNFDKAWNRKEVATHQGEHDFWVSIHGKVYDISDFWKRQHSDTDTRTTTANMQPLAGLDLDEYFVPPLHMACKGLGIAETTRLKANTTPEYTVAVHTSGYYALDKTSALAMDDWYWTTFKPSIKEYYQGELVYSHDRLKKEAEQERTWARYGNQIYDLTDYFYTQDLYANDKKYEFLNKDVTKLWQDNAGNDIKAELDAMIEDSIDKTKHDDVVSSWRCIQAIAYKGILDFRESAKCQVNNWLLLAFTVMVCTIILVKFAAALRFGSKRRPAQQDKFVICQIPAYTEDEESLRRAINSLTALKYDNKRKLLCVICDGIAVGQGNNLPTSKIILDIVGHDPSTDPAALPFKSVGSGSQQLNYGKVYSGLYEYEGDIVPYVVVIKVGKESEQTRPKPGNRGKRDTQLLLLSFLSKVYYNSPMNPLELEMYHQISDVIGVDPRLYEFLLMVDADTAVHEDALNHLVAACANNTQIAGICGETRLENEETSWWTMIQIYEYFISHHLAKAFESLFGSVTCLPGCFTMYRLKTFDGKKPVIISNSVLQDYSICDVETLHMKNLLTLGEDRYLTTLMIKYFPRMWLKFLPEAQCQTIAPESWKVLLSQRRRWINSTIHNLIELMRLENMCGICCFSMRSIVFADLFGTIIFPATCVYLVYLIYRVIDGTGQFPLISIILLAATYGLQALLFLLKRQWQHIGWMIIYLMALPVYSFFLPLYSFWNQDNFSWGDTRVVIGEKGNKQLVAVDDDEIFDPGSIPLQRWDDFALSNSLPNRYEQEPPRHLSYGTSPPTSSFGKSHVSLLSTATSGDQLAVELSHSQTFGAKGRRSTVITKKDPRVREHVEQHQVEASSDGNGQAEVALRARSGLCLASRSSNQADIKLYEPRITNDMISVAIERTLPEVDLDCITKPQLRFIIEQRLGLNFHGESLLFFNQELDCQLQKLELEL